MIHPLKLDSLTLDSNIIYAPLAGCSDYPFRMIAARYKPALMFCEMVKMEALIRNDSGTYRLLDYHESMRPIGAQLCGSNPTLAGPCAAIIEELGFDVVDLNCGCPVDKVTKDGSGSGLLKHPERIGEIIHEMKKAVSIPVTLKIRAGWDDTTINAPAIACIAREAGAAMITVHGRTREQRYKGLASRDHIAATKRAAGDMIVIGNGDLFDGEAALSMLEETACDGVLISRGTIGKPWIAEDIKRAARGEKPLVFSGEAYRQLLLDHLDETIAYQPERRAILDMRRVGCWYLKSGRGTKRLREGMSRAKSIDEVRALIDAYDWESASCGASAFANRQ